MDDEETVTNVRRTRSGKVVKTPAAKTPTRRTRKKVVIMEVEVSDEDEETHQANAAAQAKSADEEKEASSEAEVEIEAKQEKSSNGNANIDDSDDVLEKALDEVEFDELLTSEVDDNNFASMDDFVIETSEMEVETVEEEEETVRLREEKLREEKLREEKLLEEKLREEKLREEKLREEKLREEKLREEKLREEKLREEKLREEKLREEKLREEKLREEKLREEKLLEEKLREEKLLEEKLLEEEVEEKDKEAENETNIHIKENKEVVEDEAMLVDTETETVPEEKDSNEEGKETEESKTKEDDDKKEEEAVVKEGGIELDNLSDIDVPMEDQTKTNGDPDAENISEDELPGVPVAKVPETEEVSDEELPGPKRAELPADTEVVSEDELPSTVKKEGTKRKIDEGDYDPGSPTSENEAPAKKVAVDASPDKDKEEKASKPKKLPELDKYWKAVNDDPTDFTGWTYLLQYVDQENDMEAAREAYDAFLSHYPYCYGYWRKYADYEKRKGNKKKCEEVFERGLKSIPLSVDLWIHYLTYVKTSKPEDEEYIRSQFERAITACGLEFRSDRLWDSYIKWETEGKRLQHVTAIYDRLLATPTQGYTSHFDNFQEHISSNSPNKVIEVDEFLALRKEVRHMLKHDAEPSVDSDAPPGDEDSAKLISSDEETKSIRERIVSIRRKIHKNTVNAVISRWNFEEGIKRPYFHVKPLERCQLKNWQDYLDYEIEQGDKVRIIVLFERCLIACALYEEFWLKFVHYLENLKDPELQPKIRDVYERACTIHHLKKPLLHLQWAMFEESISNLNRAAEVLVNLEKSVPNVLQVAYRRINLERRRADNDKCIQLFEHYITSSKNKMVSSNIAIKYSRFCLKVLKDWDKAQEVLKQAITKDPNNPRLYLQLIDLTLQKDDVTEEEIIQLMDSFMDKESTDADQKVLFAQRKLEYLEDFGASIESVQAAYDQYQKFIKLSKEGNKKKEAKSTDPSSASKKEKGATTTSSASNSYGSYNYGNASSQQAYPYSAGQQGQYNYSQYGQGDQYQYQNWQYPQGSYGGYNQWGSYSGGYGY